MDTMKLSFQIKDDIAPVEVSFDSVRFSINSIGELPVPLNITLTVEPIQLTGEERLMRAYMQQEVLKEDEETAEEIAEEAAEAGTEPEESSAEPEIEPENKPEDEPMPAAVPDLSEVDYDDLIAELMRRTSPDEDCGTEEEAY